ncbi:unnamed protein product [Linum trigynum]|uniref:Uncharacterized protein n=1 Tax=Linum trigynum TaxID=586398 RepID=A0AAV2DYW4_9ROSI
MKFKCRDKFSWQGLSPTCKATSVAAIAQEEGVDGLCVGRSNRRKLHLFHRSYRNWYANSRPFSKLPLPYHPAVTSTIASS